MPDHRKGLNPSQPKEEVENIRYAIQRSRPCGSEGWVSKAVARFGLESTLRHPWRPAKGGEKGSLFPPRNGGGVSTSSIRPRSGISTRPVARVVVLAYTYLVRVR